jgi:hypothetical protein
VGAILSDKREKKRAKKERQKEKKLIPDTVLAPPPKAPDVTDTAKWSDDEEEVAKTPTQPPAVPQYATPYRPRMKTVTRVVEKANGRIVTKVKTKTRSRQKNLKKDNRPEEVRRAKLAEKGITI